MSLANNSSEVSGTGSYITGFLLSVALTLTAYFLVVYHIHNHHITPSDAFMKVMLPALAVIQLFVQLRFFLHLGKGRGPRWNLLIFGFALIVVLILVLGSLWIMHNLNYRMTPSQYQVNQYLKSQGGGI